MEPKAGPFAPFDVQPDAVNCLIVPGKNIILNAYQKSIFILRKGMVGTRPRSASPTGGKGGFFVLALVIGLNKQTIR